MNGFFADPLFILLIGVILVVGGFIGFGLHAFVALLIAAQIWPLASAKIQ